jgi:hypothetical protein
VALPSYNTQIVAQGLARLTSQFQTQPNIRGWLAAVLAECQVLETALYGVVTMRFLATATLYTLPATNIVFDNIGALVGQARGPLSDLQYKALILLRIAVNRATGAVPNWSGFAAILAPYCADTPVFYGDQAAIYFGCWDLTLDPNQVASSLGRAVPNGVRALFAYSTWADGSDFEWTSAYDSAIGELGWGSVYVSTVGGLLVAGAAMQ